MIWRIGALAALVLVGGSGYLAYSFLAPSAAVVEAPQPESQSSGGSESVSGTGAAVSVDVASAGQALPVRRGNFGDWEYQCANVASRATEQCILIQNVQDQADLNLAVVVLKVEDTQASAEARRRDPGAAAVRKPMLRVIAPLGVLLPRGLGLKIDEAEIGSTGFVRCIANGCVAEVEMDPSLLEQFRKGKLALFSVFLTPDEGRGLPLSLNGFERGFAELR